MKNKVKERKGTSYLGILIALLELCVVLSFASSSFLTVSNLLNVSQQISTDFLIAIGMTFIILLGGIDLSVGSIIAVTGLMMGLMMKSWNLPVLVSILLGLVFASAIGMATHNYVPDKVCGKKTAFIQRFMEISQLAVGGKIPKEKKIGYFFKTKVLVGVTASLCRCWQPNLGPICKSCLCS